MYILYKSILSLYFFFIICTTELGIEIIIPKRGSAVNYKLIGLRWRVDKTNTNKMEFYLLYL